ncbi:MAG: hydrogenase formation protein HypD [Armatimonadetes bacterium]|nr:hydrogenase formation protein HypD [Armatimonadota bacterium]
MPDTDLAAFASRQAVQALAADIRRLAAALSLSDSRPVRIMHVCGSHEHSLSRWGLRSLLPRSVDLIAGPGCPVCVCPEHEIREAIAIAEQGAIVTTYGDMLRVPTSAGSLSDAASRGCDVRLVYSAADAARLARELPDRQVVFFAVGFETTAAPTAAVIAADPPPNLTILTAHRLTPEAMVLLMGSGDIAVDALIAPGHVSVIVGVDAWQPLVDQFGLPTVVAGFEPADVMLAVRDILAQRAAGRAELTNVYGRAVTPEGNRRAQALLAEAFEVGAVWWRGLGELPGTGLVLRAAKQSVDARERFGVRLPAGEHEMPAGCACNRVMLGQITPPECPLFGTACHPLSPHGPCMVSQEGTCFIWNQYGSSQLDAVD